jgi:hypothetical protein
MTASPSPSSGSDLGRLAAWAGVAVGVFALSVAVSAGAWWLLGWVGGR